MDGLIKTQDTLYHVVLIPSAMPSRASVSGSAYVTYTLGESDLEGETPTETGDINIFPESV